MIENQQNLIFPGFCKIQKLAIFETRKTSEAVSMTLVTRKRAAGSMVDALIDKNLH
jgi:hypothetical protein